MKIKSTFGESLIITETSINREPKSKEIFRMETLEKDDEIYKKICTKVS